MSSNIHPASKITFKAFGSSHLSKWNGIQTPLEQLLTDSRNYEEPEFHPVGGGTLTEETLHDMISQINQTALRKSQDHLQVLIMYGSNDLRYSDKGMDALLDKIKTLIELTQHHENITIFFTSVIPSPRTHHISQKHYKKFNKKVRIMTSPHKKTVFINTTKHMFKKFGTSFLSNMYKKDGIHLNSKGAEEVSQLIFETASKYASISATTTT